MIPATPKWKQKEFLGASAGLVLLLLAFVYRWAWQDEERRAPILSQQNPLPVLALPTLGPVPTTLDSRSGPSPLPELDLTPEKIALNSTKVEVTQMANAEALLKSAEQAVRKGLIFEPYSGSAAESYALAFAAAGADAVVAKKVQAFMTAQFIAAHNGLDRDDPRLAKALLDWLAKVDLPDRRRIDLAMRMDRYPLVASALAEANQRLLAKQLYVPIGNSALDSFVLANQLDARNLAARAGLQDTVRIMLNDALAAASRDDFDNALSRLDLAKKVQPKADGLNKIAKQVDELQRGYVAGLFSRANAAIDAQNLQGVEQVLALAEKLGGDAEKLASIRKRITEANLYENLSPGQTFVDRFIDRSGQSPEMVVIPVGQFEMGHDNARKFPSETPRHAVDLKQGFAFSSRELSVKDFREFISTTGYKTEAEVLGGSLYYDERSGRLTLGQGMNWRQSYNGDTATDDLPVVHVSWNDAKAYVDWLQSRTGKGYRLPSEAEFEYVLRNRKIGPYPWGENLPKRAVANITGEKDQSPSGRKWGKSVRRYQDWYWGPAPVGKFEVNSYRMFDLDGNVSEWVEDCWHENYLRAPPDGKAWVNAGCEKRVVRGPSWGSAPEDLRITHREAMNANARSARIGIRVARDL